MKIKDTERMSGEQIFSGLGVTPQIAIGPAYVIDQEGVPVPEYTLASSEVDDEIKRFQVAIAKTQKQLSQLRQKVSSLPVAAAEDIGLLLDAYKGMLTGSRLVRGVESLIQTEKLNAEAAVQRQMNTIVASFTAMKDSYLAARGTDVREVGTRVLRNLMQQSYNPFADAPEGCILVAEEITPADTAMINPERVGGFATVFGGVEGHSAIMARSMGLGAVLGVAALIGGVNTGDLVIVDGCSGTVIVRPTSTTLNKYKQEVARLARETRKLKTLRDVPSVMADGTPVKLYANLELPREIDGALETGAEGIGLLRTEFLYMNRPTLPTEDEQFEVLVELVRKLKGRPLTVRTLDVGGDKLAKALGGAVGESVNPALGLRAIRLGLKAPKLLETQLAAILRAAAYGPVRILVPMISTVSEMVRVREHLFQVERRLRRRGVKLPNAMPHVGAMIEIPGAALTADALSKVCDFFAIGSNDLTQYTLAVDRGDERLADLFDPFHPGVLRLIQFAIAAAWRANIPISLCGEIAGNPKATALLMGLGLREFSMSPTRLPAVKQEVVSLNVSQSVAFAEAILSKTNEEEIRGLLSSGVQSLQTTKRKH